MGDEKNEQHETHRFDTWIILAISSAITLGSMADLNYVSKGAKGKWSISCAAITMSIAVIIAVMYKFKSNLVIGTDVERCCTAVSAILWIIFLAIGFHDAVFLDMKDLFEKTNEVSVLNANIYYFSWISFFASVYLLADLLVEELDLSKVLKKRFTKWFGLLAFSLVVMSSSISYFQNFCPEKSESCSRSKLAMLVGLINSFLSLLAVLLLSTTFLEKFQLYIETCLSFLTTVICAVTVGYITGGESPGSMIGNLYYFTWLSVFSSVMVFSSCAKEMKVGTKDESEEPVAPKGAPSVEESPTVAEEHHEEPAQEQAQVAENV